MGRGVPGCVLRRAAPLLLLQPSCLLALVAIAPRAAASPSPSTVVAVIVTSVVAIAPLALLVRALVRQPA